MPGGRQGGSVERAVGRGFSSFGLVGVNHTGFVDDQGAVESDMLGHHLLADNIVIAGHGVVELAEEDLLDAAAFLVDGIFGGVDEVVDAGFHFVEVLTVGDILVELKEFETVVDEFFEEEPFGVAQEKEIKRFGQGWELDFAIAIVGKEDAEVAGDAQVAEGDGFLEQRVEDGLVDAHLAELVDAVAYLLGDCLEVQRAVCPVFFRKSF